MSANVLHDPTHPHGTPAGFAKGCHGSHCPAVIPCRDVHRRYVGDYTFRTLFNGGVSLEDILEREQEALRAARRAEREARRVKPRTASRKAPSGPRNQPAHSQTGQPSTDRQRAVVNLHSEGLTDKQIAARLNITRDQVRAVRRWLNLPYNEGTTTNDRIRELHAQGMNDIQIGKELGRSSDYVGQIRRRMGLKLIKYQRARIDANTFRAAHARGLTDRQIAEEFGIDIRTAAKRRRYMILPLNQPSASPGVSSCNQEAV